MISVTSLLILLLVIRLLLSLTSLKELKSNDNIIITKDDKGIQMDNNVYFDNVNTLLQEGPYVEMKND